PSTACRIRRGTSVPSAPLRAGGRTIWWRLQKARDFGPFGSAQGRREDNSGGPLKARHFGPFGSAQGRREDNSGREGVGKMCRALPALFVVRAVNPALALRLRSGQ